MRTFTKKLKRGISLIEVVIAIFIIALVSASATTLILTSVKNDQKNVRDIQIALATQTTVDCFNYANDLDEFEKVLKDVYGAEQVSSNGNTITLSMQTFSIKIEYSNNSITIKVFDNNSQELSEAITYKKG